MGGYLRSGTLYHDNHLDVDQIRHLFAKSEKGGNSVSGKAVVDLEGVRVVRLNPTLEPNYFNFMGKYEHVGKMLKTNPLLMDLNPRPLPKILDPPLKGHNQQTIPTPKPR